MSHCLNLSGNDSLLCQTELGQYSCWERQSSPPPPCCPGPSHSFRCFHNQKAWWMCWEPCWGPWPCCMLWQSIPCAMPASTELEIWYRDLAVTIQCTGLPAQRQKGQGSPEVPSCPPGAIAEGEAREPLELVSGGTPSGQSIWHSRQVR
jgi:hypothetical protein